MLRLLTSGLRGRAAVRAGLAGLLLAGAAVSSRAALFDDDEARKAIIDLRSRFTQLEAKQADDSGKVRDEVQQLRRSLLDANNQIESLKSDMARLRGSNEQLTKDLADAQRAQKDIAQNVDDRLRKFEPQKVNVDGKEFTADPDEHQAYDAAVAPMKNGDFTASETGLTAFVKRYPGSGYIDSARFWLGNAQYGKREYREAIASFRAFVTAAPNHPRAPEALLAIANCQVEMKDSKTAKRTLDELVTRYPGSEAATAAKERLASLK